MEWQVKNSGEIEMNRVKNRNSVDDIGAERRAVWTKTTSPDDSSTFKSIQDIW